jgi:hypothetical protein
MNITHYDSKTYVVWHANVMRENKSMICCMIWAVVQSLTLFFVIFACPGAALAKPGVFVAESFGLKRYGSYAAICI